MNSKHKVVRIGHPARVLPHIQKYSLDAILSASDESKLVDDVRKDIDNALVSCFGWSKVVSCHMLILNAKHSG